MIGDVMSISRLRMGTDGEGVSTLITMHGCPLSCKYCINDYCHDEYCERGAYTPEKLIEVLKKDDIYYKMSGGSKACLSLYRGSEAWTFRNGKSLRNPRNSRRSFIYECRSLWN